MATGESAIARNAGESARAAGVFSVAGDAQAVLSILRGTTTNATPTALTSPGVMLLQNDSTWAFTITVSARRTNAYNESANFEIKGSIDRNTDAASTAIVGAVTKTVIARDSADWDVTVDADTSNGSLRVVVTGETGKTIRWVAVCNRVEVVG
jgi:hypothetical protein